MKRPSYLLLKDTSFTNPSKSSELSLSYIESADKIIIKKNYNQNTGITISSDIRLSILKPTHSYMPTKQDVQIFQTCNDLNLIKVKLSKLSGIVSVDIETRGTQAANKDNIIVGIGLADSSNIYYFDFLTNSFDINTYILKWLKDYKQGLIGYNVFFDGTFLLRETGTWLGWVADVYAMYKQLANEGYPGQKWGLKQAQLELLNWESKGDTELEEWLVNNNYITSISKTEKQGYIQQDTEEQGEEGEQDINDRYYKANKAEMWRAPADILGYYCGLDAASTYQLYSEVFLPSIKDKNWEPVFLEYHNIFLNNVRLLGMQQLTGINIDKPGLVEYDQQLKDKIQDSYADFVNHPIVRPFADMINQSVIQAIIDSEPVKYKKQPVLGQEPEQFTKSGEISKNYLKYQEKKLLLSNKGPELTSHWIKWESKLNIARTLEHFNLNSPLQLSKLFYDYLNYPILVRTEGLEPRKTNFRGDITNKWKEWEASAPATGSKALPGFGEIGLLLKANKDRVKEQGYTTSLLDKILPDDNNGYRLHPQFKVPGTLTCRLAGSGGFNCFHPDTEYLTMRGWISVAEIQRDDYIWQVNPETKQGSWAQPLELISADWEGTLYKFGGSRGELKVTDNHRMAWYGASTQDYRYLFTEEARDLFEQNRLSILHSTLNTDDILPVRDVKEIWIACMLQADGSKRKNRPDVYTLGFRKERKINKATELLNIKPVIYPSQVRFNYVKFKSDLLTSDKILCLDTLSIRYAKEFVSALAFWDGHKRNVKGLNIEYGTKEKENANQVMAYLSRAGYNVSLREYKGHYRVYITDNIYSECKKDTHINTEYYKGKVYCVMLPDQHLLVRAGGRVWVTGQTQQVPKTKGFLTKWLPPKGKAWVDCDVAALEQVVLAELSRDESLLKLYGPNAKPNQDVYLFVGSQLPIIGPIIKAAGYDPDCPPSTTEELSKIKKQVKHERGIAKQITLGCIAEDTLIHVEGKGLIKIQDIKSGDKVWTGDHWEISEGAIDKGVKPVYAMEQVFMTADHKVLGEDDNFYEQREYWKISEKSNTPQPKRPKKSSATWSEVWTLGSNFLRRKMEQWISRIKSKMPPY